MSLDNVIVVTIHGGNRPIHNGHRELFEYAKTIGNNVVAVILRNGLEWNYYLSKGVIVSLTQTKTDELEKSLKAIGIPFEFQDPIFSITEDQRLKVMDQVAETVQKFREQIILKRVGDLCGQV
jgi:phosphopantetheine adenylyltransferase